MSHKDVTLLTFLPDWWKIYEYASFGFGIHACLRYSGYLLPVGADYAQHRHR